ncbi:MAG: phenylacetate--CoA ligase [Bacillota bacterium]
MYFNKAKECMTKEEKFALQSERLKEVVTRVYNNVPTYRKKMEDAGVTPDDIHTIKDIVKLPFTTKQDLRDNYPFGMFAAPQKDIIRLHASSGTTGKLTVVGYTQNDIDMWSECCARGFVGGGCTNESTVHVAYGYGLFTGGLGAHYGAEMLGATAVPVSSGNTQRQIMLMKDFKADTLCCTPSYAVFLGDEIAKMGLKPSDLSLKRGFFGAEPWTEEMRNEIEAKLGLEAYDIYGLSEIAGPGVATECEFKVGSHINEDFFYPEIVDKETLEQLPFGEKGELVFTTLTKEGIPLIRYRTRDITALTDEPCKCGRTGVRIARINGRSDDMLIIRGVNVFPSQIESVLLSGNRPITPHYHIYVDRINNLDIMELEIELSGNAHFDSVDDIEKMKKTLAADIASAIGISAKIKLVSEGSVARSEGKAKRVTDRRTTNS